MMKSLLIYFLIGIMVAYFKMRQSRTFGFDRKLEFKTLPHIIIGIILWPYLIFLIFSERKVDREAYRKAMTEKTEFDRVGRNRKACSRYGKR